MATTISLILSGFAVLSISLGYLWYQRKKRESRYTFIQTYKFPTSLRTKLLMKHPELDSAGIDLTLRGLRQYFLVCLVANAANAANTANAAKGKMHMGMPSRIVDDAWHEFILISRAYSDFCQRAFGAYLHHAPEATLPTRLDDALANTLRQFRNTSAGAAGWAMIGGVPLLFAIDRALAIPQGYHHDAATLAAPEERKPARTRGAGGGGCAGDLGAATGYGGGGGDGGSGCGGGCGSD